MEEILASIRRIISEDEAPAETAAAPAAPSEPEAAPVVETSSAEAVVAAPVEVAAPAEAAVEEDVLELTDRYETTAPASIGDLDVLETADEPFPEDPYQPQVEQPAAPVPAYDSLVGDSAAASAASAFAGLAATFQKPETPIAAPQDMPFVSGNTVEAMVQAMLRPMLKDWLDANLPGIVEAQVRKEVERIARSAG